MAEVRDGLWSIRLSAGFASRLGDAGANHAVCRQHGCPLCAVPGVVLQPVARCAATVVALTQPSPCSATGGESLWFQRVGLLGVQRMQGAGLVQPQEGVVASAEPGGHVVAHVIVLGVVHDADGAVGEIGGEQVGAVAAGNTVRARSGALACSACSSEPGRASGTDISRTGAPHELAATTVPWWLAKPISATWSSPWRSRASWPMLILQDTAMVVAGVPDVGVVRPHHRIGTDAVVQQPVQRLVHAAAPADRPLRSRSRPGRDGWPSRSSGRSRSRARSSGRRGRRWGRARGGGP
ncbi:hypothetical protein DFR72_103104 [Lentzea flaviverrucosa]|uniref:Uncharacterized protein n=1 Tax=Lentzea flaviverrucosa TaxID=200379 RepID=A0A1H9BQP2_9PSEU|nr:hypothetical protein DFR72_103104 [Lentzea flaviverrucosa]SEP91219.1 hypothetical protein SAMN05216195_101553 [Lentzea flaviverrucosa]